MDMMLLVSELNLQVVHRSKSVAVNAGKDAGGVNASMPLLPCSTYTQIIWTCACNLLERAVLGLLR